MLASIRQYLAIFCSETLFCLALFGFFLEKFYFTSQLDIIYTKYYTFCSVYHSSH